MNKSESINELATALAKAQGEFGAARMDKVNPFLKNTYADLGSVIEAAKAACTKNGLAVSQPASTDGATVAVTTVLMHSSGQWISSEMALPLGEEKGRSIAQAAGSIITYLRRYSLSAILGIYADEDTDGNDEKPTSKRTEKTNGNGHKPDTADGAPMTVAEAEAVTNKDGVRYGDLDNEKLSHMANALAKLATRTPEQEAKLLAIQVLFKARNEANGA